MGSRKFPTAAAAAAALLLTGTMAVSSAGAREPWPGDPRDGEPSRPHPNCEGLSDAEMLECERRMRERMLNSSDDPETVHGTEEIPDRRDSTSAERSSNQQAHEPPVQSTDRKRISQRDTGDRARTPNAEDRTRSSSSPQQRSETDASQSADSLGRAPTRQPDHSDNSSPRTTTETDTSPTSRDADDGADTLDRDRNPDNSATDTSSPR